MDIQQIKQQTDILRVISSYLTLKRSGQRYMALCPFHDDHNPSLIVDPRRQTYKCFACGAGGDVINFIKEMEKCTFKEAVEKLEPTGHPLHNRKKDTATDTKRREQTKKQQTIPAIPSGGSAPYIPSIPGLGEAYLTFEVIEAYHTQPAEWKMMAGRILFPVRDEEGILTGYAGREQTPPTPLKEGAKYLNTPGLPRSSILYGLHLAKEEIKRTGTLCLVEGVKDAIAMHAAGWTNTVALMGNQMAAAQKELILRYAEKVILVMDGDDGGRHGREKIIHSLQDTGLEIISADLPEGSDPDSLFRDYGGEVLAKIIYRHVNAPHPAENLLITAITLYPETTLPFGKEVLSCPLLTRQLLQDEDLLFESETNREILHSYAPRQEEEFVTETLQKEIFNLQIKYGDPIRRLTKEIRTYHQCGDDDAKSALLRNALLVYCETRLIRLTKHLTRSLRAGNSGNDRRLTLLELSRRREQLTLASQLLNTAGAK